MSFDKTNKRNFESYVIGIPCRGNGLVQCVVLWQSNHWKNAILLGITDKILSKDDNSTDVGVFQSLIFGSASLLRQGIWKLQGQIDINVPDEILTFHAAGNKYYKDEFIGPDDKSEKHLAITGPGKGFIDLYLDYVLFDHGEGKALEEQHSLAKEIINEHPIHT